ncbi:MAG: energy-coupling factor transporter transmembrane protein EcfT [Bacillota bacterium]
MIRNIALGQYYPADSPLHRMDPRTKILIITVFIIILFITRGFLGYALLAALSVSSIMVSRVPVKLIYRSLRPIVFILVFTVLLHLFMTKGEVLFRIGPLTATWEGARQGAFMATRLVLLIMTTSLLTLTTSPIALTDGLELLLKPFARLGVPAHELAMMMTIALRFIPTLLEEAEKIMKAQMARGADFQSGNVVARAKSLVPLLVPLFVSAFRRADELAMAMEARCYRGGEKRTRMKELTLTTVDWIATAVFAAFVVGSLVVSFGFRG